MGINNINLMGPNPAQPFDIQTEQAKIAQAQQIAQLLLAQGTAKGPTGFMTGEGPLARYVPDIGGIIAKVVNAGQGRSQMNDAQAQQAALAGKIQDIDRTTGADVTRQLTGAPAKTSLDEFSTGDTTTTPASKRDYMGAIKTALASTSPQWKAWGQKALSEIPGPKDLLQYQDKYDPASVAKFVVSTDPADLREKKKAEIHDNVLTTTQGGVQVGPSTAVQHFTTPTLPNGQTVSQSTETGETKTLGTFGNATPLAKYADAVGEKAATKLAEGSKTYSTNIKNLGVIGQIQSDLTKIPDSAFGTASGFRNAVGRLYEALGATPDESISSVQGVQKELLKLVVDKVHLLAPASDTDVKIVQNEIGKSEDLKRSLIRAMDVLANSNISENTRFEQFVKNTPVPAGLGITPEQHYKMWVPDFTTNPQPVAPASGASPSGSLGPAKAKKSYKDMTDQELLDLANGPR